jgi:predicted oxidoreductase (fatty acid repression mutant protein)
MAEEYLRLITKRRTYYSLANESPIPDSKVIQTVQEAMRHSPSSLNGRTSRVVVLLGDDHRKLWGMALEIMSSVLSGEQWEMYEKKLNDRKGAYGTVRSTNPVMYQH